MNRRNLLQRAAQLMGTSLAGSVLMAISACSEKATQSTYDVSNTLDDLASPSNPSVFTDFDRKMIEVLVELIIPETETPGAAEAGVGGFIDTMVTDWYQADERDDFIRGLRLLNGHCLISFDQDFLSCSEEQRQLSLEDAEQNVAGTTSDGALGGNSERVAATDTGPWGDRAKGGAVFFNEIKSLTVLGYYTSEIGSTQELIYDPVPGTFDGDVDFQKTGRHYTH